MISLEQIETDLVVAMKAKDQLAVEVLRGLKTRVQNQKISKMMDKSPDLSESDIIALIKNEVKRRKEAAETYKSGGREELANKELKEAAILEKYLPEQMSEQQLAALADAVIAENNFAAADFGKAMGAMKAKVGQSADGAVVAKVLKEKLK